MAQVLSPARTEDEKNSLPPRLLTPDGHAIHDNNNEDMDTDGVTADSLLRELDGLMQQPESSLPVSSIRSSPPKSAVKAPLGASQALMQSITNLMTEQGMAITPDGKSDARGEERRGEERGEEKKRDDKKLVITAASQAVRAPVPEPPAPQLTSPARGLRVRFVPVDVMHIFTGVHVAPALAARGTGSQAALSAPLLINRNTGMAKYVLVHDQRGPIAAVPVLCLSSSLRRTGVSLCHLADNVLVRAGSQTSNKVGTAGGGARSLRQHLDGAPSGFHSAGVPKTAEALAAATVASQVVVAVVIQPIQDHQYHTIMKSLGGGSRSGSPRARSPRREERGGEADLFEAAKTLVRLDLDFAVASRFADAARAAVEEEYEYGTSNSRPSEAVFSSRSDGSVSRPSRLDVAASPARAESFHYDPDSLVLGGPASLSRESARLVPYSALQLEGEDLDEHLHPGDIVLAIDEMTVAGCEPEEVANYVAQQAVEDGIVFKVARPVAVLGPSAPAPAPHATPAHATTGARAGPHTTTSAPASAQRVGRAQAPVSAARTAPSTASNGARSLSRGSTASASKAPNPTARTPVGPASTRRTSVTKPVVTRAPVTSSAAPRVGGQRSFSAQPRATSASSASSRASAAAPSGLVSKFSPPKPVSSILASNGTSRASGIVAPRPVSASRASTGSSVGARPVSASRVSTGSAGARPISATRTPGSTTTSAGRTSISSRTALPIGTRAPPPSISSRPTSASRPSAVKAPAPVSNNRGRMPVRSTSSNRSGVRPSSASAKLSSVTLGNGARVSLSGGRATGAAPSDGAGAVNAAPTLVSSTSTVDLGLSRATAAAFIRTAPANAVKPVARPASQPRDAVASAPIGTSSERLSLLLSRPGTLTQPEARDPYSRPTSARSTASTTTSQMSRTPGTALGHSATSTPVRPTTAGTRDGTYTTPRIVAANNTVTRGPERSASRSRILTQPPASAAASTRTRTPARPSSLATTTPLRSTSNSSASRGRSTAVQPKAAAPTPTSRATSRPTSRPRASSVHSVRSVASSGNVTGRATPSGVIPTLRGGRSTAATTDRDASQTNGAGATLQSQAYSTGQGNGGRFSPVSSSLTQDIDAAMASASPAERISARNRSPRGSTASSVDSGFGPLDFKPMEERRAPATAELLGALADLASQLER